MKAKSLIFFILTILCCAFPHDIHAQGTRITGVVNSDEGPVMMCNVVEIDENNRNVAYTQTDINGNFSLDIKNPKHKLRITYVGYQTYSVVIGSKREFNIMLKSEAQLQEVVVTAGNRFNRGGLNIPDKEVSMAVQKFDMSQVEGLGFTSADEALQGQIAGLDVVVNSGNLGAGTSMRLRGITSITGSSEPLIVVDGNIFETADDENFDFANANEETYASLLSINPEDISTISVLKDAAATAIWGSRGANGVIEITTKRGSRGKIRVDYSLRLQANWQPKGYNLLNGDDYTMMLKEMYYNPSQAADATTNINEINYNKSWAEYENWNNNTDWVKAVTQTGVSQYHYVTISGGGEKANFRVSAGYDHQIGSIIKQSLDRFSTRLTLDYFVSDRIKFSTQFPLTYTRNNKNYTGLLGIAQKIAPNMSIYRQDANGNDTDIYYIMLPSGANNAAGSSVSNTSAPQLSSIRALGNPVAIANEAYNHESQYRISPDFRLEYQLLGIHDDETQLKYTGQVYFDIYSSSSNVFYPGSLETSGWTDGDYNRISTNDNSSLSLTTRHTLTFTPRFKNKDFYSTMMARWEMKFNNSTSQSVGSRNLPSGITSPSTGGNLSSMSTGNGEGRSMGAIYTGHFSYKGRYAVDPSLRLDGTTRFGDSSKWGIFPGFSARWNISEEPWMNWSRKVISMLSFRPSWGIVGRTPGREYLQYARYRTDGSYGSGSGNQSVTYLEGLQLNKLKWEKTSQWNIGGDFGFFNDKITGDFNYYYKRTKNLLMGNVDIPSTAGFSVLAYSNVGEMSNKGWELNVSLNKIINVGKFSMTASVNVAQNFNRIESMDESVLESLNDQWNAGSRGTWLKRIQVGNPLGSIFGLRYKGVYQYSYEYLTDQRDVNNWDSNQFRDFINQFLASGKTAPVATDASGRVLMNRNGEPVRVVYNYLNGASTYQFQGGDAIYEDVNHDGQINQLDVVYLGNSNPQWQGGFNLTFNYGRFSLRSNFSYRVGFKEINKARMSLEEMYNAYNQSTAVNFRWRKDGDVTQIPRAMYNTGYNWLGSDRFVETGSFLRLSYIQLRYSFERKMLKSLGLNQLALSVSIQNPFVWSHYSGTDPEHSAGSFGIAEDNSQTPRSKSVTMNLNIGF